MPERAKIPKDAQDVEMLKRAISLIHTGALGDGLTIIGDGNGRYSARLGGAMTTDPHGGIIIDYGSADWKMAVTQGNGMLPCLVTQSGGAAGTLVGPCTYTYTVTDLLGNALGGGKAMTPEKKRPAVGPMVAPAAGSYGTGFWDLGGWVLWDPNEVMDAAGCST